MQTVKDEHFNSNIPTHRDFIFHPTAEGYLNKYFVYRYQYPVSLSFTHRAFKYITISSFCDLTFQKYFKIYYLLKLSPLFATIQDRKGKLCLNRGKIQSLFTLQDHKLLVLDHYLLGLRTASVCLYHCETTKLNNLIKIQVTVTLVFTFLYLFCKTLDWVRGGTWLPWACLCSI